MLFHSTRRPSPGRRTRLSPCLLFLSVIACQAACGPDPRSPPPPPATRAPAEATAAQGTRTLAADTTLATPSGATLTVPAGWHVTLREDRLVLEEPDRELRVVILETAETDLREAVEQGMRTLDPRFARKVERTRRPPPAHGWDESLEVEYELLTNERRVVIGVARREGAKVHLALIDGGLAAFERRGAEIDRVAQSLRPPGGGEEPWRGRAALPLSGERLAALDAFIEHAREKLGVPGAAIAVVQGGKVVFEKGYGVREQGKKAPVTPRTLFMVGSITKSLTSLLMAVAVDEGRMSWDTKVHALPLRVQVGDPDLSRTMAIKHTVCACTGLPPRDLQLFFTQDVTPQDQLRELATLRPTTRLGETFQYSNLLVAAGGWAAAQTFGRTKDIDKAYAHQLQAKVLAPMGMTSSTLDMAAAAQADHASPHAPDYKQDLTVTPLSAEGDVRSIRPAGALWSSVRDMARYLLVELGQGKTPEGKRVVSEASLLARREPQVEMGDRRAYGLAIAMREHHGIRTYGHAGRMFGFASVATFLPDHDAGWVVLTNAGTGDGLHESVKRKILGLLFQAERDEASEHLEYELKTLQDDAERARREIRPDVDPAWARELTGTYEHPGLGRLTVSARGSAVTVRAGERRWRAGQKTESDGTRKLVLLDPPLAGLGIVPRREAGRITLLVDTPQEKYVLSPALAAR